MSTAVILEVAAIGVVCAIAFNIRMAAVNKYGMVIHEFDPWFNYRATEYLVDNGYSKFSTWYDDKVWWPLGRPVGSTVYPGMMITASTLYKGLNAIGITVSLNDVCVLIPAVFAMFSCVWTYALAREVTKCRISAVLTGLLMAIVPAHLMRSVAGGYDNESVAIPSLCATLYLWIRSIRSETSWPYGILAGISYTYLVATWGGYIFVVNIIGVHVAALLFMGRISDTVVKSYTAFLVTGVIGALQVPIVGWAPLRSMEQICPIGVWMVMLLMKAHSLVKVPRKYRGLVWNSFVAIGAMIGFVIFSKISTGEFWAMSARVRALFIQHTRTGNPLVDSVAEHRSPGFGVFLYYLHSLFYFCLVGCASFLDYPRSNGKIFVVLYFLCGAYFSIKMIRLVILFAPAAAICGGQGLYLAFGWVTRNFDLNSMQADLDQQQEDDKKKKVDKSKNKESTPSKSTAKEKKKKIEQIEAKKGSVGEEESMIDNAITELVNDSKETISEWFNDLGTTKHTVVIAITVACLFSMYQFGYHCFRMSHHLSEPQIIVTNQNGTIMDDYREAYWYIRDNTPEDSRILAWWDYGYQINGVANRTTIADGNTWNHEQIALLGRALILPEKPAHEIARHLADYVLVWSTRHAGMWGDDIAKMPHMARIVASVFSDVEASDYSFQNNNEPTEAMTDSLLYKIHSHGIKEADPPAGDLTLFEEFFTSKNKMVRVFKVLDTDKESKNHPVGSYPPALQDVVNEIKPFGKA
eukprot:m.84217 g.84217  ORF g.84217 m.84217 type:complete len:750 (-) comp12958_c0_seq2:72-2321(-)